VEKGPQKNAMTTTLPMPGFWISGNAWRQTGLLILLPTLLAAGLLDKSGPHLSLPDENAYRSPLSENLLESNQWRIPQKEKPAWRIPATPPLSWRTPQAPESNTPTSTPTIELFPRYQPGNPSDFDYIKREEKPLIKIFEFGSK